MNVNYRIGQRGNTITGWPLTPSAYDTIANMAQEFRAAGFSALQLPPATKGAAGQYSAGYDLFDPYDIGSKPQPFNIQRTAYGTAEELRRCVAIYKTHDMQVYGDLVLHQYLGGTSGGVYTPLGSDGKSQNGRFPKTASCFVGAPPRVGVDPVPDSNGNFAFGDMASYVNSTPKGYMHDGAIAAAQWLTNTLGLDGYRIDDAKGTNWNVVYDIFQAQGMQHLIGIAEYFDGNPYMVHRYIWDLMHGRVQTLDFAFKFNVGNICNNNTTQWMGALSNIGYCLQDSAHAVTFVESADSDTSLGQQTIWNKILGYAIMLTFPGYPQVYYKDWQIGTNCYGLKPLINQLVWIHETFANGPFVPRWDNDPQVFVHERTGWNGQPGCLCAFNNDQYNEYTRIVQTSFGPNQELHEYTGNGSYNDRWTDANGNFTFTLPKNNNGMSYLVFAKPLNPPAFSWTPKYTTQTFYGDIDLDTGPITNKLLTIGRIWCQANTKVELTPHFNFPGATVQFLLTDPDGKNADINNLPQRGWYTITAQCTTPELTADQAIPFSLTVKYLAPGST